MNLDFDDHNEMWEFFKLLKQKEKDDTGLYIQERKIWATVDKPPATRLRDKMVRRAGLFIKQKLNLGDNAGMEIDWKIGLIWVNSTRIARIHKDTNLMKFNTEYPHSDIQLRPSSGPGTRSASRAARRSGD